MKQIKIALAGNPNSGKTTVFNSLTGASQRVANYPGVTVEKKEGKKIYKDYEFKIFDLPGTYSLTAYSLDEIVARDFIIDEKPDLVIDVLDSTNIERNLYLLLQFRELNIPIIGALNISDQAESRGIKIDSAQLSSILDIPMVKTSAVRGEGLTDLLDEAIRVYENKDQLSRIPSYGDEIETEIQGITDLLDSDQEFSSRYPSRWLAIKLLEKDKIAYEKITGHPAANDIELITAQSIQRIESHFGSDAEIIISEQRYGYINGAVRETVRKESSSIPVTEKVDRFLLNRYLGLPVFFLMLWAIFQITFKLGVYPQEWLERFFGWTAELAVTFIPEGLFQSLVVDGVIAGLGGVLSFVPLIIILFMFISFLEDSGYMARAAFIMDKFLHIFGLHGQSFLPLMVGFGCSIPAVMAARTLKNPKDRIITILVTPLMNCGAKLPVHILLAGTFFSACAGNMVLLIYITGVLLALLSSLVFKKTILKGEATPFVMELPPYRMPTIKGVCQHIIERTLFYLKKAGTILFPASIILWALITFPKPVIDEAKYKDISARYRAELVATGTYSENELKDEVARYTGNLIQEEELAYSYAGRMGHGIEPLIEPLGFDWKIGVASIAGFAAKEVVVSTLGILYKSGAEEGEESETLRGALKKDKTFSPLVAFVLMLFTLIMSPCLAAQATIKSELGWKWLGFYLVYSTLLAWGICFAVYQTGKFFGIGVV